MSNQFIEDYTAAVAALDEQQAKLDAANAAARRARVRVKDARERVETLREYADLFGVTLPDDVTTASGDTPATERSDDAGDNGHGQNFAPAEVMTTPDNTDGWHISE